MRLIDADALNPEALYRVMLNSANWLEPVKAYTHEQINDAPTVDVDSRGNWICRPQQMVSFDPTGDEIEDWYECSACKYGYVQNKTQYCPGCGAKMDDSEKMGEGGRK